MEKPQRSAERRPTSKRVEENIIAIRSRVDIVKADVLIDTDVFIDFLRGHQQAIEFVRHVYPNFSISVVSVAELYSGVRDGKERKQLESALEACNILDVTGSIAKAAGLFKRTYGKSHGVHLPDALIAATVHEYSLVLATLNRKHFPMLTQILEPYRKTR